MSLGEHGATKNQNGFSTGFPPSCSRTADLSLFRFSPVLPQAANLSVQASAGLLTRSFLCAFPAAGQWRIANLYALHEAERRNSQQRVLSQILTAFPFHSSARKGPFRKPLRGKYSNKIRIGAPDAKKDEEEGAAMSQEKIPCRTYSAAGIRKGKNMVYFADNSASASAGTSSVPGSLGQAARIAAVRVSGVSFSSSSRCRVRR